MAGQSTAFRIGVIAAVVVGTVAIPATAFAANGLAIGVGSIAGSPAAAFAQLSGGEHVAFPLHDGGWGGPGSTRAAGYLAKLAAALGVTPEALRTAMAEAQAVTKPPTKPADAAARQALHNAYLVSLAGKLNVSVDALKAAMEQARPPKPLGRPEGRGPQQYLQALATALGVTPEALTTAMREAQAATKPATKPVDEAARQAQHNAYLAALAAKLNVGVDKLKAAMEQARPPRPAAPTATQQRAMLQPRLTELVKHGRITQAQAAQILADVDTGSPAVSRGHCNSLGELLRR